MRVLFTNIVALLVIFSLAACAPNQAAQSQADEEGYDFSNEQQDPLEPLNRAIFSFNEALDALILKPVALGYNAVVPEIGRTGVKNFLGNLSSPVIFANALLQGDGQHALATLWRFILNTTLGFAGVYDFAAEYADLDPRKEDFGQTLGVYGIGQGPYVMLPILGASSLRDTVGRVADFFMDPFTYALRDEETIARGVAVGIDTRSRNIDLVNEIYRTSLDPYATIRSLYLQKREAEVENRTPIRAVSTGY